MCRRLAIRGSFMAFSVTALLVFQATFRKYPSGLHASRVLQYRQLAGRLPQGRPPICARRAAPHQYLHAFV